MPIAPWPTAGRNTSTSSTAVAAASRPSRFRPASASRVASTTPSSSFLSRVSTLPRNVTTEMSGRRRLTMAWRRNDAVPTTAPCGRPVSEVALRLMKASRTSSRGRHAASSSPAGSAVGMSLLECTARSIVLSRSACSISLVNKPFPPASDSGRSWMTSPVVRIGSIAMASGSTPWAAARCARTSRACHSASGLPRVPIRRNGAEDCAIRPHNATRVSDRGRHEVLRRLRKKANASSEVGPARLRARLNERNRKHPISLARWNSHACARYRNDLRRDGGGGGGAPRRRPRYDSLQCGAVADRRTCGIRRGGAGNRSARPCGGARSHHRDRHGGSRPRLRHPRWRGGRGRAGLIGGVIVGLITAKAIALVHEKPLIAVNHLEAHALTARLTDGTPFPYCLFPASWDQTQLVAGRGVGYYVRLGTPRDDANGEACD